MTIDEKVRFLLTDAISCLDSCIVDDQQTIDVLERSDLNYINETCRLSGRIDGYKKAIELLEYVVEQVR